jgi:hypothetical protein
VELNVVVKERSGGKSSAPVVLRSVDDLDKCSRSLAGVIKAWLRQVPLTRGGARKVFDITATWSVDVPKGQTHEVNVFTSDRAVPHHRVKRAVHRVARGKRVKAHGR